MAKKLMSQKLYRDNGGTVCPGCGGCNVDAASIDADGSVAKSDVVCLDCKATWTDIFVLKGYTDFLEKGETI